MDWIARALARAGVMPPAEAEEAVRAGRVAVAGRVVRQPMAAVQPGEKVTVDGKAVSLEAEAIALMFHKPKGAVSSRDERGPAPTVFDLLLPTLPRELAGYGWHAIGRLDKDTTGLLLFTNHERLVGHVTDPKTKLAKRYRATVSGNPTEVKLRPLQFGVVVGKEQYAPAKVRMVGAREVELTLTEGKNHQVKKMLGAVGLPVMALHREAIGGVALDVEGPGDWRKLSDVEIHDGLGFSPVR